MKAKNIHNVRDINTHERLPQPRGFRARMVGHREYYVRLGFIASKCTGEAHSNAYIDHCSVCLGDTWGVVVRKDSFFGPENLK